MPLSEAPNDHGSTAEWAAIQQEELKQGVANGTPWDCLGSDAETDLVQDDVGPIA
ncbi:hypothetical protein ACFWBN_20640 [Streptomyces sp. NPDC059989]|uniref:hypothetical protein n=1 Tax=Streptomyces sp. NPDC059989 TaxID=3347026 RepID=UPI00369EC08F